MPLRTCEVAQCQCCENYSRLGELTDVQKSGDVVTAVEVEDDNDPRFDDGFGSKYVGICPHCGENIYTRNIC